MCFFAEIGNERRVVEGRDDVSGVFFAEISNERRVVEGRDDIARGVMTLTDDIDEKGVFFAIILE